MKKIFLLFAILISLVGSAQVQTGNYYVSLKVKYQVKKDGMRYEMYIDLGDDKQHPLYNVVSNSDKGILVKEDGKQLVLLSEVDVLSYLKKQGWVIDTGFEVTILGAPWANYILKEQNRQ